MILIHSDDIKHGNHMLHTMQFESLKDIFNSRQLQSKQITLMGELGGKDMKKFSETNIGRIGRFLKNTPNKSYTT